MKVASKTPRVSPGDPKRWENYKNWFNNLRPEMQQKLLEIVSRKEKK